MTRVQPEATLFMKGHIHHTLECCLQKLSIHATLWLAGLSVLLGPWELVSRVLGYSLTLLEHILQRTQKVQEDTNDSFM